MNTKLDQCKWRQKFEIADKTKIEQIRFTHKNSPENSPSINISINIGLNVFYLYSNRNWIFPTYDMQKKSIFINFRAFLYLLNFFEFHSESEYFHVHFYVFQGRLCLGNEIK